MKPEKQQAKLQSLLHNMNAPAEPTPRPRRKAKPAKARKAKKAEPVKEEQTQISAYIPKTLYKNLKVALASQDEKLTLTDLLIKLLTDWTGKQR